MMSAVPFVIENKNMTYTMHVQGEDGAARQFVHRDIIPAKIAEDKAYADLLTKIGAYTMTIQSGAGATYNLFKSVKYIVQNRIRGDIVECGVWRGGSMMLMAYALQYFNDRTRSLYLYDTYNGMTEPDEIDIDYEGRNLRAIWQGAHQAGAKMGYGGSVDSVRGNLRSTGYPPQRMNFIEGDVLETIPATLPEKISLLRLDTDFYKSTLHELTHLYPRVVSGGVIYIDDYGWCKGARQATDEYFSAIDFQPFLARIDETVRIIIKP